MQVGDYNLPYQLLTWIGTYVPIAPMHWFKIVSVLFDFLLAVETALLVRDITEDDVLSAFTYGLILFLPEQLMNSALWGQCDAIYSAFLVISLRCLLNKRSGKAFFFFGISLSFKLQACFIVPFFIFYYLKQRDFSIVKTIWTIPGFCLLCVPSWIMGRSISSSFDVYLFQIGEYPKMTMNYPSLWGLINGDYPSMKLMAISLTFFILLSGFLFLLNKNPFQKNQRRNAVMIATWMIFSCVEFLPSMHERYGFFAFLMLAVTCLLCFKSGFLVSWALTLICVGACYTRALFGMELSLAFVSVLMFCAWTIFTFGVYREMQCGDDVIRGVEVGQ